MKFYFETGSHVAKADLKLRIYLKMTLDFEALLSEI